MCIYIYRERERQMYTHTYTYIYIYAPHRRPLRVEPEDVVRNTANLPTNIVDLRGLDSSIILN